MNLIWEENPKMKNKILGKIIFPFQYSDTFIVTSVEKKIDSTNDYELDLKLNSDSKFGKWLTSIMDCDWKELNPDKYTHLRFRNNMYDELEFYKNKDYFEYKVGNILKEKKQKIFSYCDDITNEYITLIFLRDSLRNQEIFQIKTYKSSPILFIFMLTISVVSFIVLYMNDLLSS
jgi:hypothetical protein